jgi:hypothetical protein
VIRRVTGELADLAEKSAAEAAAVLRNGRRALAKAIDGRVRGRLRRALDELAVTIERTAKIVAQTRTRLGGTACGDNHQVAERPEPADPADAIWNRSALDDGGPCPRHGDGALSAVLRLRGLAMSGGLLDAVERLADHGLDAAERGYAWLGHPDAARLIAYVRDQIRAGGLQDADGADRLERQADQRYAAIIPADATLYSAFRRWLAAGPSAFASAGN